MLSLLCAPAAFAEPGDVERRTPPVVVEAVRPGELPEDPSAFTTVIEMDAFEGEAKSVEEVLGESVGVQVRRFGGPGDPAEISIRGSTASQVVILLDGVRLNTAQTGAVDLSTIPAALVERIEVSRGGGSVQTGSDAVGGVVNIVTRRPGGEQRTTASFSGESFDTWTGSATHAGTYRDVEVSLGYSGFATDGDWEFKSVRVFANGMELPTPDGTFDRVNNESESHSALVTLARDLGERGRLSFSDSFLYDSAGRPGPATTGVGELQGQSLTAQQRRVRNVANLAFEWADVSPLALSGEARLFHRFDRSRFRDPGLRFLPQDNPVEVDIDNRNHSLGGRFELRGDWAWGWARHAVSVGTEVREDWLDAKDAPDHDRTTDALFVQDDVGLWDERLRIVPGLRFDHTDGFDDEWIPRVGVIVRMWPWLSLKGNVERSYRVPNFDELYFDEGFVRGNPNLDPEDAFNADVGFELAVAQLGPISDAWLELAVFRNDIDESIVFQLVGPNLLAATNTGGAKIDGIELAGGFRAFDWLAFSGNWTRMDPRLDGAGNDLPGRADEEYQLRADLGPSSRSFKLIGERRHTSSIPITSGGGSRVSGYTVYDVGLVVDLAQLPRVGERVPGRRLLFSVTARNVGDVSRRDSLAFPQPGRMLAFRIEWEG